MARHSKWHQIKRKKAVVDAEKSKLFTQLATHITKMAHGSKDPHKNPALAEAIQKARAADMPQSNIDRLLHKNTAPQQEITYEAVGSGGSALLIVVSTNNTRRTIAQIRQLLEKHHSKVGKTGSVRWKFKPTVTIVIPAPTSTHREALELACIDAGANDIEEQDSKIHIHAPYKAYERIKTILTKYNLTAEKEMRGYSVDQPQTVTHAQYHALQQLIRNLKKHPDVVAVHTNIAAQIQS